MDSDDLALDLEPGDFLYQVDQELFLVVMDERDDSYLFSVHGWRDIGKERVAEYIEGEHGKLHEQSQFESAVEEKAAEDTMKNYERLKELFDQYADDFEQDVGDQFAMDDN